MIKATTIEISQQPRAPICGTSIVGQYKATIEEINRFRTDVEHLKVKINEKCSTFDSTVNNTNKMNPTQDKVATKLKTKMDDFYMAAATMDDKLEK